MVSNSWRPLADILVSEDPENYEEPKVYRSLTSLWPDWHKKANCYGEGESVFFGASDPDERPAYTMASIREAKSKCAGCPVFEVCLRQAIKNREQYGVWATTTMKERAKMFKRLANHETTEEDEVQRVLGRQVKCV